LTATGGNYRLIYAVVTIFRVLSVDITQSVVREPTTVLWGLGLAEFGSARRDVDGSTTPMFNAKARLAVL
jgi:hypothetical protein